MNDTVIHELHKMLSLSLAQPFAARHGAVVLHNGQEHARVESLERFEPKPRSLRQRATLTTYESFVDYVNVHKLATTRLLLRGWPGKTPSFTLQAIIDYHDQYEALVPSWCEHIAEFTPEASRAWVAWNQINGRHLKQAEFAEFIEDNLYDIVTPEPARMLEIATTFRAKRKVNYERDAKLSNGDMHFVYTEETTATARNGEIAVPEHIHLMLPVFHGELNVPVKARLRYRIGEDKALYLAVKLERPIDLVERALQKMILDVQAPPEKGGVGIRVWQGCVSPAGRLD